MQPEEKRRTALVQLSPAVLWSSRQGPPHVAVRLLIRTLGLARATTKLGLANLVTNMRRLVWFELRPPTCLTSSEGRDKPASANPTRQITIFHQDSATVRPQSV
jgi:hypothetical protein